MEQKDLQILADVYNNLARVSTRGEDTIRMGQCLFILKDFIETKAEEINNEQEDA